MQCPSTSRPLLCPQTRPCSCKAGNCIRGFFLPPASSVLLHIYLVSQGPDLRVGKCCANNSPALEWGMTASLALEAGVAPACALCSGSSSRLWVVECDLPPRPLQGGASVPLCPGQLGSCRRGPGHAALHLQVHYTHLWLRLAAIIQNPRRKWPDLMLPAH